MLVLSRRIDEGVVLQREGLPDIEILVLEIRRGRVRLGISADDDVVILRDELLEDDE